MQGGAGGAGTPQINKSPQFRSRRFKRGEQEWTAQGSSTCVRTENDQEAVVLETMSAMTPLKVLNDALKLDSACVAQKSHYCQLPRRAHGGPQTKHNV